MLYSEIIAVCSLIHTKHINTVCGQNVELMNVKLAVHIVTTGLQKFKQSCFTSYTTSSFSGIKPSTMLHSQFGPRHNLQLYTISLPHKKQTTVIPRIWFYLNINIFVLAGYSANH